MSYSTVEEVKLALTPSTAPTNTTAASLTDTEILDQIAEADGRIDAYIGARYVTPVAPLDPAADPLVYPATIKFLSRDIGAYLATLQFRRSKDMTNDDPVYRRFVEAMNLLKAVAGGTASLPGLPENGGDTSGAGAGDPISPYNGDLFSVCDFDLAPSRMGWDRWSRRGW